MHQILQNVLIAFGIGFLIMSTICIFSLPAMLKVSGFWYLLSMPSAAAWATLLISLAAHDWRE